MCMERGRSYYPGRWTCQKDATKCDGTYRVWDVGTIVCPLALRCQQNTSRFGQLERLWKTNSMGRILSTDACHHNVHKARLRQLEKAFFPERTRYRPEVYQRNKDSRKQIMAKYSPPLSELVHGYVPLTAAKTPTPPCGGDCRNCPYDKGACRYPDWEERNERRLVLARKRKSRYQVKKKERMVADPQYAAVIRAKRCEYSRKARAKIKWVKSGGTPEEFEKQWKETMQNGQEGNAKRQ